MFIILTFKYFLTRWRMLTRGLFFLVMLTFMTAAGAAESVRPFTWEVLRKFLARGKENLLFSFSGRSIVNIARAN